VKKIAFAILGITALGGSVVETHQCAGCPTCTPPARTRKLEKEQDGENDNDEGDEDDGTE